MGKNRGTTIINIIQFLSMTKWTKATGFRECKQLELLKSSLQWFLWRWALMYCCTSYTVTADLVHYWYTAATSRYSIVQFISGIRCSNSDKDVPW